MWNTLEDLTDTKTNKTEHKKVFYTLVYRHCMNRLIDKYMMTSSQPNNGTSCLFELALVKKQLMIVLLEINKVTIVQHFNQTFN